MEMRPNGSLLRLHYHRLTFETDSATARHLVAQQHSAQRRNGWQDFRTDRRVRCQTVTKPTGHFMVW